jgi:ArsR family transcriptional regulator
MKDLLLALRAIAEPTRLRILVVLDRVELTVGELCRVLGQSQPRVSRHLKLLVEAGVLERNAEGTSAFYHLADGPIAQGLTDTVRDLLGTGDLERGVLARDIERLGAVRAERAASAAAYFEEIADSWEDLRRLHVSDSVVETELLKATDGLRIRNFLDIGTGTGRMLEVFADRIDRGVGIDLSSKMLNLARSRLDADGLRHCSVRHGNIYDLDVAVGSVDVVVVHHVLHFLDDPASAIAQAARTLGPNGMMLVVDFAPHHLDLLRKKHAHLRLGFTDAQIRRWCEKAGMHSASVDHLNPTTSTEGEPLTVSLWTAYQSADAAVYLPVESNLTLENAS